MARLDIPLLETLVADLDRKTRGLKWKYAILGYLAATLSMYAINVTFGVASLVGSPLLLLPGVPIGVAFFVTGANLERRFLLQSQMIALLLELEKRTRQTHI